jgi:hypothetical protein
MFAAKLAASAARDGGAHAEQTLGSNGHSWREHLDLFYLNERVRNWAGPVLAASSRWYDLAVPFLSEQYWQWSRTIPEALRKGRTAQKEQIAKFLPELANLPYASDIGDSARSGPRYLARFMRSPGKVLRRLAGRRAAPDLGAAMVANELARDPGVQASLSALFSDSALGLRPVLLGALLARPQEHAHELGACVTAAWALDELRAWRGMQRTLST